MYITRKPNKLYVACRCGGVEWERSGGGEGFGGSTVPSGGNVTCLEGSRQRGNRIPARQLCRILSSLSHASIHARHGLDVQSEISNN